MDKSSYKNAKICYICKEKFENRYLKDKKYRKVRDHWHYTWKYRGAAYSICNLKQSVPKKIPIAFHNEPKCYLLRRKHWKIHNLHVPIEKNLEELMKMEKKW